MVVVFVAVHGVKVTAPLIGVAYLFAVGVGHRQHSSPAVVLVIHGEAELLVAVGQDDGAGLSCDIAQRVIRELMAPRAVTDMDGTPFGGAAGAVGVCHIVSRHVAISFSISRAQRANHAVFVLCRGEKTSCNNVCSAPCSMCSRKKFPQVDSVPLQDCPRCRRCSGKCGLQILLFCWAGLQIQPNENNKGLPNIRHDVSDYC